MFRLEQLNNQIVKRHFDYLIIGAGMAGLYSAQLFAQNGVTNFLILEAQQGVGGRVETVRLGEIAETNKYKWVKNNSFIFNFAIEKGATWVQQAHYLLLHLAQKMGISIRKQHRIGVSNYLDKNKMTTSQQMLAGQYSKPLLKFIQNIEKLAQQYSKKVIQKKQIDDEYRQYVLKYDNMRLTQYIQQEVQSPYLKQLVHGFLEHIQCLKLADDSMHEILLRFSRSGDLGTLTQWLMLDDQSSFLINGGTQQYFQKFQLEIEKKTGRNRNQFIRFEEQVISIDNSVQDKVKVKVTKHGNIFEYTCKKVILTVPVGVLDKLSISNLSPTKKFIFQNQTRNLVNKSFIVTRRPFWKDKFTGDGLYSMDYNISMSHDVSPHNNECGILVFFHCGDKYTKWHQQFPLNMPNRSQTLRKYFRTLLARMYLNGNEESPELQDLIYVDLNMIENRFVNSAFQSNCKPGTLTQLLHSGYTFQKYYEDEPGILFVGSQFSDDFNSFMQGAVRVASKKIHKLLNKPDPFIELVKKIEAQNAQKEQLSSQKQ